MKPLTPALLCLIVLPLSAADLYEQLSESDGIVQKPLPARFRLSYEVVPLSQTDDMGLVGTHFDWHPFETFEPFYTGFGFYSAASGEEGGFFTFGYSMGLDYELYENFHVDAGVYIGGGGGGHLTFPGGGMIIRTQAALSYATKLDGLELVIGIARTDFPNTTNEEDKSDLHPFAGLNITDDLWTETESAGNSRSISYFDGLFRDVRLTPTFVYYDIDNKATKRALLYAGNEAYQENFPMLGMQMDKFLTDEIFVAMEAYGALGSAAGYAAIEAGLGYDMPLTKWLIWESKMIAGFAGDGRIDTGGGFILQPMTGLRLQMTPSLSFKTLVGRTYAPSGLFSATTYEAGISWQASRPVPETGSHLFSSEDFENLAWVISPSFKMYFPYDSTHKSTPEESEKEIGLVGIIMAFPLNSWFSLTGSTHWAMIGNAGSYAEGLFGAKLLSPPFTPLDIRAKLHGEIGAGAGGSINTASGGYVTQALAGLELPVSQHTALGLDAGEMRTSDGRFKAKTLLLSLNINLNFIYQKQE